MLSITRTLQARQRGFPLRSLDAALALNRVGEATVVLPATHGLSPGMEAEAQLSVAGSPHYTVLLGHIERVEPAGHLLHRLTLRERAAALEAPLTLHLRGVTPPDVLAHLERRTGLRFLLPRRGGYLQQRHRTFEVTGTGLDVLAHLARAWRQREAVWTQLPDGRIYWGDWRTAPYTGAPLPVEPALIVAREPEALVLHCFPGLRPGMVLAPQEGGPERLLVRTVTFTGDTVRAEGRALRRR